MVILEGRQSVAAALRARRRRFQVVLIRHGTHAESVQEILDLTTDLGVAVRYVDGRELDSLAHGTTHGGVLAIASAKPRASMEELLELLEKLREPPLLVLLEGVDDARNLGFTIRSAEALGVHALLIKKHLWDFDETEVARPASGSYERLPLIQIDEIAPIKLLQSRGLKLFGCIAGAKRTIYEVDLTQPSILAIGGEKRGLSGAVRDLCDRFVTIPSRGDGTSLSLSHASAIAMGEAMRQRLASHLSQANSERAS
jgi:23S rRNA (guanosine2251-2'-O)-methyltransferase